MKRGDNSVCTVSGEEPRASLEKAGLRYTRQRAAVYRYLHSVNSHPTAEQVFAAVREEVKLISLATVYKALDALVAAGVAARFVSEDGVARYDGRSDCHYHLRCLSTGQVRDLPVAYDPALLERIAPELAEWLRQEGFELTGHRLEIVGQFHS